MAFGPFNATTQCAGQHVASKRSRRQFRQFDSEGDRSDSEISNRAPATKLESDGWAAPNRGRPSGCSLARIFPGASPSSVARPPIIACNIACACIFAYTGPVGGANGLGRGGGSVARGLRAREPTVAAHHPRECASDDQVPCDDSPGTSRCPRSISRPEFPTPGSRDHLRYCSSLTGSIQFAPLPSRYS